MAPKITRRDLLVAVGTGGSALGGAWLLHGRNASDKPAAQDAPPGPPQEGSADVSSPADVIRPVPGMPESLGMYPSQLGVLPASEMNRLWAICEESIRPWGKSSLTRGEFSSFVGVKTGEAPSYLAEYRNATEIYHELVASQSPADAVAAMFAGDVSTLSSPREAKAKMVHAQVYVLFEFLRLHLVRGGYQLFGLDNYKGFAPGLTGYRSIALK